MDPVLLKVLHLASAFALFGSLGAILLVSARPKSAVILHGISLLALLLIGFALLKKPPMTQSWWMIKIGLWLFMGFAPVLAKRRYLHPMIVFILVLLAGAAAAWFGLKKPF
jgi:hypothetical protein